MAVLFLLGLFSARFFLLASFLVLLLVTQCVFFRKRAEKWLLGLLILEFATIAVLKRQSIELASQKSVTVALG